MLIRINNYFAIDSTSNLLIILSFKQKLKVAHFTKPHISRILPLFLENLKENKSRLLSTLKEEFCNLASGNKINK